MLAIAVDTAREALWTICLAVGAGCLLTVVSRRLHLPTIVLLLFGGVALGPEGVGLLRPASLGHLLPVVVSLAVGLILFEGGLTLQVKDFVNSSRVIRRLLTVGVLITWLGAGAAAYAVFEVSFSFALLMGSLVIVTGPTVIVPLLRRIRVVQRLGSILHWEAVLVDSVGVFVAILCFEWVIEGGGTVALPNFLLRLVSGAGLGAIGGYGICIAMKRGWVPDSIVNAFALASAVLLFGLTELIVAEAGLLTVTVAGLIVGLSRPRQIREIRAFKAEITDILIGMLFLLLVSRLELRQFAHFFGQGGGWVLAAVILLVRPLSVVLCSLGSGLCARDMAFLSWVAPRGVVAASMASLFALSLETKGATPGDPALLESFTYSVICATVLIQGLSAGTVARALGLQRPPPNDWLVVGAHYFGREIARRLRVEGQREVVLLDTNARNVAFAREDGFRALHRDAMEAEKLYEEQPSLSGVGYVLALTDKPELNQVIMQRWGEVLSTERVFGWIPEDSPAPADQITGHGVFADLSSPILISNELINGESDFATLKWGEGTKLPSGDWHPLFVWRGRSVRPVARDTALKDISKPDDRILCLSRPEGILARAIHAGARVRLACSDITDLYTQLADLAEEWIPGVDRESVLADLGTQEKVFPAFIGHGVAIPHVYCDDSTRRVCFLAELEEGLPVPGLDEAVTFVFFLVSPSGDSEGHLATLAEIARICRSDNAREAITAADTVDEALAALGR